ncbi:kinase-like domain-containing protein [Rhizophagus diaphanus]|nr:kinase-like domain-containing protein [Rhizophagus diaphanus] [Rhizophagus sp. MUCL 43196]
MDLECSEHKINRTKIPQSIQECCSNCVIILCFKQTDGYISDYGLDKNNLTIYNKVIESEKYCKLCGKSLYQGTDKKTMMQSKLCSDCYLISSGFMESTLFKKRIISIVYLPWWYNSSFCNVCRTKLQFTSDCQKYCVDCYLFYIGCRYCLTTNIIFGLTGQSQCRKCKRVSSIINSGEYSGLDDFLLNNIIYDNLDRVELADSIKIIDKYFEPQNILNSIFKLKSSIRTIRWIPFSQFMNVKEITKGGYGTIYIATWSSKNEAVILKRFENSKNVSKYFLNELKALLHCIKNYNDHLIKTYGFTKDPELGDYIIVMKYASGGDLHKYLQKSFTSITWNKQKLHILWQISMGLETIHVKSFMHRDFHSGNILFDSGDTYKNGKWKTGDLGLSQAVNNKSSNNEIYGVIPYIAPEIFKGSEFTKEADIYSLGMIMWELTTGRKPFDNVEHDHNLIYKILDGERPEITEDTPECYANLMKSCWDPDPKKRPSIKEIRLAFGDWVFRGKNKAEFDQAETKRIELIKSKKIGPEFAGRPHPRAIYTSRPLSAFISKCSSINSTILFDSNYISKLGNNTNTISLSSQNLNSTIQNFSSSLDSNYISEELELDIDTERIGSLSSQNLNSNYVTTELELDIESLSSTNQNFPTSLAKRRIESLNVETQDDSGKYLPGLILFH